MYSIVLCNVVVCNAVLCDVADVCSDGVRSTVVLCTIVCMCNIVVCNVTDVLCCRCVMSQMYYVADM